MHGRKSRLVSGLSKGAHMSTSEGSAHMPSCMSAKEAHWSLSTGSPEDGGRPGPGIMRVIGMHLKSQIFLNLAEDGMVD